MTPKKKITKKKKYYEATGRRKTATARVRLFSKTKGKFLINKKSLEDYLPTLELQEIAKIPLKTIKSLPKFEVSVLVKGGGIHSQAEAIRHGLARALLLFNKNFRKKFKELGFLTRDPRMKERKNFGLKRARRAPQWQKR